MKFSTIAAVVAMTIAFVTTGCVYDKNGKGGAGDGSADGNITDISGEELTATEGDDINALAGEQKFEDMYAKCTDVDFEPVYFGFDASMLPKPEFAKADAVANHLRDNANRVVVIEGNCDERGSNEYNVILGESRAITLRNYFVSGGIDVSRIQTRSAGEEKPAVEGHDESAWAKNRRAEFGIYDTKQAK